MVRISKNLFDSAKRAVFKIQIFTHFENHGAFLSLHMSKWKFSGEKDHGTLDFFSHEIDA